MTKNDIGTIILELAEGFLYEKSRIEDSIAAVCHADMGLCYGRGQSKEGKDHNGRSYKLFRAKARCMIAALPCAATGTIYSET